jgi:hypothetical protein
VTLKEIKTSQVTAPRTSWTLFMIANKVQLAQANPGMKQTDVVKLLSDKWNAMSKEEK